MNNRIRKSVRDLVPYTPGEQPAVPGLIKLNTNENPYPPSPRVAEALRAIDPARLRLYPNPVCAELRGRIAANHGCRVEQVFVGNGSDEILSLCTRAFVEDDGTIGYFDPSYSLYPVLADIRVAARRPVPLAADFGWQMPAGYHCSLFFLTNPNAPTGVLYDKAAVRAFCADFAGVVLIDEAYVDFARENAMDLALSLPNVLVLRTLSKSFSLAGLRVGYVVGAADLVDALYRIKDSYNVDAVAQTLALAALSDLDGMRANARRIIATRERLAGELRAMGFAVVPSETNFLMVRPPALSAQDFFEGLRRERILVRWFAGTRTGDYVRITVGTDDEVNALLAAARRVLKGESVG